LGDFFTSLSGHPAWSQSEIYNYIQRQRWNRLERFSRQNKIFCF
jgi:hypothetical protein